MFSRALRRFIDINRLVILHKREVGTKRFSFRSVGFAKSKRYKSLFDTMRFRAAMFENAPESADLAKRIHHASWYLSPSSNEDEFCADYVRYLQGLKSGADCDQLIKRLRERKITPFVRTMLNPP